MQMHGGDVRAGGGGQQRVAVGRRARDQARADRAVGAAAVVDHDGLAERIAELAADEPCHQVERRPGRERHHHGDRLRRWASLRRRRPAARRRTGCGQQKTSREGAHGIVSPSWLVLPADTSGFALLAKAGAAFDRFRRMERAVEVAPAARPAALARPAFRPAGAGAAFACAAASGPASSSSSIRRASAASATSAAQSCVDEADAHRLVGREALARQQIAAQAARARSRAGRTESAAPARSRAAPPASRRMRPSRGDHDVAAGHERDAAADAGAVDERDGRLRRADRARGRRPGMVARGRLLAAGAGAPISAPTQKCLPAPRSTITRTAGSAPSRVDLRQQRIEHRLVVAVALLGTVERERRDRRARRSRSAAPRLSRRSRQASAAPLRARLRASGRRSGRYD